MDKQNALHQCNRILFIHQKEWSIDTCYNRDERRNMVLSESSQAQKAQVVWFHCYGASSLDKCVQPEGKAVVTGRWGGAPQVAQQGSICSGDTGDSGLVPGWGRSPGEGNGNPLQYSCLKNPMGRGAWRATVRRLQSKRSQRVGRDWVIKHSFH